MAKRSFSGISVGHSRAVKRRKGMGGSASQINRRSVSSLTAKVNKILSEQERKNFDQVVSQTLVAGTAVVLQLSSIPQGDDATSRDGRKIAYVSSHMRYTMKSVGGGTPFNGMFRVIVMHDKQSNGVSPVAGDILTVATNIRSPLTMDFKERFRVIHDNFCSYGKGDLEHPDLAGVAVELRAYPCEYFKQIGDDLAQAEFGGIGNIPTSNSLLMLVLSESAATFEYYHRLRFTDT